MDLICFWTSGLILFTNTDSISLSSSTKPLSVADWASALLGSSRCSLFAKLSPELVELARAGAKYMSLMATPRSVPWVSWTMRGSNLIFTFIEPEWRGKMDLMSNRRTTSAWKRASWKWYSKELRTVGDVDTPGHRSSTRGSWRDRTCSTVTIYWGCFLSLCWNLSFSRPHSWSITSRWVRCWSREQVKEGRCRFSFSANKSNIFLNYSMVIRWHKPEIYYDKT